MTGATYRQLDNWCSGGVFGDRVQKPGSGTKRRFTQHEVLHVAIVHRIAATLQALNPGAIKAGSVQLYAMITRVLRGELPDTTSVFVDLTELTIVVTAHSTLTIDIDDLLEQFSEENLLNG